MDCISLGNGGRIIMYYVQKRLEIAGAHHLELPYNSKCENLHGHNWIVTVYCKAPKLTEYGMVVDFTDVKRKIHDLLDHQYINDVVKPLNPTAENLAKWICDRVTAICEVGYCYKVQVQESEGNIAVYERDKDEGC
jgi:6-pyruvoyltetrahydropterin/6-carboxytetrahydropterin synthase